MTTHERKFYKMFLREVLDYNLYLPNDQFESEEGSMSLFNPRLSFFFLLERFQRVKINQINRRFKNIVDPEIYQTKYRHIDRFDQSYFFSCSFQKPAVLLNLNQILNVTGLVGEFTHVRDRSMTAAEAVLYILYNQFIGNTTAYPHHSIVTITTDEKFNTPLVVGFDEEQICNRVRFYNAKELMSESIGTHEVHSFVPR